MKITKQGEKFLIEVDDKELEYLSDGMDLKESESRKNLEDLRHGSPCLNGFKAILKKSNSMAIQLHNTVMGKICPNCQTNPTKENLCEDCVRELSGLGPWLEDD